jgi:hypothetical protein
LDYRLIYKMLAPYVAFSFKLPNYRRDFSPQQKSAITRRFIQLNHFFTDDHLDTDHITFISNEKIPFGKKKIVKDNIDAIFTKKGFFYKYPKAKLKFSDTGKTPLLEIKISAKNRAGNLKTEKNIFVPIREEIRKNPDKLQQFVYEIRKKWNPSTVQWSYRNMKSRVQVDFEKLALYFSGLFGDEPDEYNLEVVSEFEELQDVYEKLRYRPNLFIHKNTKDIKQQKKRREAWERLEANPTWQFLDDREKEYYFQYWNKKKLIDRGEEINGIFLIFYL